MQQVNNSGIEPAGHRVLILPDAQEEMTKGGIFIPKAALDKDNLAVCEGVVIALGICAYQDQKESWCKPGDRVVFKKYEGFVRPGDDGLSYRVIDDLHVWAVIKSDQSVIKSNQSVLQVIK